MRLVSAVILETKYELYSRKGLARTYGYSQRHINRVIHEIKEKRRIKMTVSSFKEFVIKNLKVISSVVMIISLFVGSLIVYSEGFGQYTDKYGIAGYHLIFNTSTIYAVLLLVVPVILLFMKHFQKLNDKAELLEFVLPMVSLAVLMVIRMNVKDAVGLGNAAAASYAVSFHSSFGLSGWLYLVCSIILILLGAIQYFKLNVTEKTIRESIDNKNIKAFSEKKNGEESNEKN